MEMQLNKIFYIVIFLLLFSCKGDAQENKISNNQSTPHTISQIDFFNKKYFSEYLLLSDESTPSEHPLFNYFNCDENLYFTVHFVPKDRSLESFWKEEYFVKYKQEYDDLEKTSKVISQLLKNNYHLYNIFSYQIEKKYLDKSYGCTEETINIKNGGIANIYLYNQTFKKWEFKKQIKSDISPSHINNSFFQSEFPPLFTTKTIQNYNKKTDEKIDSIKIPKYSTWSLNCKSNNRIVFIPNLNSAQFNISDRFSMNSQLKKIDINKYELYFTDFPPIIPLPDNMQIWENMDEKRPVGTIEIISESKLILTWFGFYHKKLKKNIETKNPFNNNNIEAILISCPEEF